MSDDIMSRLKKYSEKGDVLKMEEAITNLFDNNPGEYKAQQENLEELARDCYENGIIIESNKVNQYNKEGKLENFMYKISKYSAKFQIIVNGKCELHKLVKMSYDDIVEKK